MTEAEVQHIQRMFSAWRQITGDGKMVHVQWFRPAPWLDMDAFVEWAAKQRGAKSGTLSAETLDELRARVRSLPRGGYLLRQPRAAP